MKFKHICLWGLALLMLYVICTSLSIFLYGNRDETRTADAAVILGSAVWGDEPSPVFEERIRHGILLYQEGYVRKLIFTGGKGEGQKYSESSVAKKYAIKNGIPENDIFLEEQSSITQENLEFVIPVREGNNLSSFLIVSDPLHMKRAMLMAKDYNFQAYSSPTRTSRYKSAGSRIRFLARETFFYTGYCIYRIGR